jgi:exosome complex component CSL4
VIKALCKRCRMPMKKRGNTLYCEYCDRTEYRKYADDYGDVDYTSIGEKED